MTNLFKIPCAKFYKNWLSFVDITKQFLCVFLWGTVDTYNQHFLTHNV